MNMIFENPIILSDMEDIYQRNIKWEKFRNKTILITGAYGMLASYITFFFIYLNEYHNLDVRILTLVKSKEKAKKRFKDALDKEYFEVVTDSMLEPINLNTHVDYIIHAASLASPQHYCIRPIEVCEPNVIGTYHLLKMAQKYSVDGFLMFSSSDVYGELKNEVLVTEDVMGIIDPLDNHSCYNESKRIAETLCKAFYNECNLPIKIARIWHTYAPTMDIENDPRVFASFIKCILSGKDITMLSDGSSMRSFCYISDAVAGYLKILLDGTNGEAYNVCNTDTFMTIRNLAEILTGLVPEKHLNVIVKKRENDDAYLENMTYGKNIPINKKLKELGWECRYDCSSGFRRILDSFQFDSLK